MQLGVLGGPRVDAHGIPNQTLIPRSLHFRHAIISNSLRKRGIGPQIIIPCRPSSSKFRNLCTVAATRLPNAASNSNGPTILWFKHDLRIDDHPGLHEALVAKKDIIPFFCFDPKRYEAVVHSPASAAGLARAVTSLRSSLRALGSDLVIANGSWEEELPKVVKKLGAHGVIAEEELESGWKDGADAAITATTAAARNGKIAVHSWTAPLFNTYCDRFKEWKERREAPNEPLEAPSTLPLLPDSAASLSVPLPSPAEILEQINTSRASTTDAALRELLELEAAAPVPRWARSVDFSDQDQSKNGISQPTPRIPANDASFQEINSSASNAAVHSKAIQIADNVIDHLPGEPSTSETIAEVESELQGGGADWGAELAAELAAGEGPVMEALNSYLRHVETSADSGGSSWQWKLGAAIAKFDVPAAPDGCFPALFNRAIALGVVSRRRIYSEAVALMKAQGGETLDPPTGLLQKLGWLLTSSGGACAQRQRQRKASAAAAAAEAGDFHAGMAREREGAMLHGATLRHWRWRGILTDYLVAHPKRPLPGAPAVLLVHGFGAFGEHWRDNVAALAAKGLTVYAPTFPGYGRAEKPSVPYGQNLWCDFLSDFVLRVVRTPVVAAGNSIGGFIAASLAADSPGAVTALVLVNSAGLLKEGYAPPSVPPAPPSPPLFIVEGVSRALFAFLQGDVTNQLRRVYPVVPSRADPWLGQEISRASSDPGALGVFRSVFYLPKPRALNYLVTEAFGGPTLVLQGAKDPLNDAEGRAKELDRLCGNAKVVLLDAGHCPHDEVPEQFNARLGDFLMEVVGNKMVDQGAAKTTAAGKSANGAGV